MDTNTSGRPFPVNRPGVVFNLCLAPAAVMRSKGVSDTANVCVDPPDRGR